MNPRKIVSRGQLPQGQLQDQNLPLERNVKALESCYRVLKQGEIGKSPLFKEKVYTGFWTHFELLLTFSLFLFWSKTDLFLFLRF